MESVKGKNNLQIQDVNYLKVVEIISKLWKLAQDVNYLKVVEIISKLCKLSQGCANYLKVVERQKESEKSQLLTCYTPIFVLYRCC